MKRYFAYTRVSTVKQGEQGSSLHEQKEAIEAYAQRHRLPILAWFEETETAATQGREAFNSLISRIEQGEASGVLIHKIDRSARNLKDWARLGELIDRGIEVHFVHESLDLASRGGRLAADIQAVVAADYIRNLRQEVKKGFYGRLKQGFYPLPAPLGYVDHGAARVKTIDPIIGPLIATMFELYASGEYSLERLRHEMFRRSLRSPLGKPYAKNTISLILNNPFYIGRIHIKRTGEVFEGKHAPLVKVRTFKRVQDVLSGKQRVRKMGHEFAYRRVLKCYECKRSMSGEVQKRSYIYYRCHSPTCYRVSIREEELDAAFAQFVGDLALSDDELRDFRDFRDQAEAEAAQERARQRQQRQRALALCEARLEKLTNAFLDGDLDRETFHARKAALIDEKGQLTTELKKVPKLGDLEKKFELAKTAQQSLASLNPAEKRQIVLALCSNFAVRGKEPVFEPLFPFDVVLKTRNVLHGGRRWSIVQKRWQELTWAEMFEPVQIAVPKPRPRNPRPPGPRPTIDCECAHCRQRLADEQRRQKGWQNLRPWEREGKRPPHTKSL